MFSLPLLLLLKQDKESFGGIGHFTWICLLKNGQVYVLRSQETMDARPVKVVRNGCCFYAP